MSTDPKFSPQGGGARKFFAKNVMENLSSDIVESADVRKEFMANPEAFIKKKYGTVVSDNEREFVKNLQEMVASGFCCRGCGCSGGNLGKEVINPAIRK
jgi:hypothetical protein